jgi:hypothetical protein
MVDLGVVFPVQSFLDGLPFGMQQIRLRSH